MLLNILSRRRAGHWSWSLPRSDLLNPKSSGNSANCPSPST
jgi:hypothetical protein